jgi:predicted enzyme related to lactoylglutathione lyase
MKHHCAGAVIYAKNPRLIADFYQHVVGMSVSQVTDDFITLEANSFRLVLLQIPERLARMVTVESPPLRRENAAIKPIFYVKSLANSREAAAKFGGALNGTRREWTFEGATVCDGSDPEGNVYQLRESKEEHG